MFFSTIIRQTVWQVKTPEHMEWIFSVHRARLGAELTKCPCLMYSDAAEVRTSVAPASFPEHNSLFSMDPAPLALVIQCVVKFLQYFREYTPF